MRFACAAAAAALMLAACGGSDAPAGETPAVGDSPAAAPAAAAPSAAAPSAAFGPAAGRWEMTVQTMGMTMPGTEICYERQVTMAEAQKMQQQAGVTCSEETYSPDGRSGHSVCTVEGMTVTTDFKVDGDYSNAYTMTMTSSMDPAPPGIPNPSTTTISARRLGDCTPDTPRAPM